MLQGRGGGGGWRMTEACTRQRPSVARDWGQHVSSNQARQPPRPGPKFQLRNELMVNDEVTLPALSPCPTISRFFEGESASPPQSRTGNHQDFLTMVQLTAGARASTSQRPRVRPTELRSPLPW